MNMTMNEKKILFTFGCPNREATVTRLCYVASLAVDPTARKLMVALANKLNDEELDEWYRNFYYNIRVEAEYSTLRQYQQEYRARHSVAEQLDRFSQQERYKGRYKSRFNHETE